MSRIVVIGSSNVDNSIIVMPGANNAMTKEDITPFLPLVKEADYLLMQLETPVDVVEYAACFVEQKHLMM